MISYLSYLTGLVAIATSTLVLWLLLLGGSLSMQAQGHQAAKKDTVAFDLESRSAIQLIYHQVVDKLQNGNDRKNAYDLACEALRQSQSQGVSQQDSITALFIHAYASQEFLDEHTKPYRLLRSLLTRFDRFDFQSSELKRRICHSLTSSCLVLNKLDSAVYFANEADILGKELYGEKSCKRVKDYFLLSYSLIESGQDKLALTAANEALQIAETYCSELSPSYIDAHRLMGYYYVKSNYQATKALPFYKRALQNSIKIEDADRAFKSLYFICRTGLLTNDNAVVNDHITYFDSIYVIADRITRVKSQIARLDIEYTMARQQQNLELAISKKNEFSNLLKTELPERRTAILDSYYSIVEMTIEQDKPSSTKKYLGQLLAFTKSYQLNQDQLLSLYQIQSIGYIHIKQWEDAMSAAQNGIALLHEDFTVKENRLPGMDEVRDLYFYRQFLITCAEYYENKYVSSADIQDLEQKYKYLDKAVACVIGMIERDDERMSKQSIDEIASDFERLIISNINLYNIKSDEKYLKAAFQLTDVASNLTFFRGANQRQAMTRTHEADSLIELKRKLTTDLIKLELAKNESSVLQQNKNQEHELDLRIALSRINLYLEDREPLYMANVRAVHSADLQHFQSTVVDSQTAFIQYFYYEKLYAFLVLKNKISYIPLPTSENFEILLRHYKKLVSTPDSKMGAYIETSRALASILLDSILIELPSSVDRLIITPYGKLANISFESLLINLPIEPADFGNLPYLIKDYAVSYAFSMTSLTRESQRKSNAAKSLLGIAPIYKISSSENSTSQHSAERIGLLPLPGAQLEINNIGKIVKNKKLLIGPAATKEEVLRQMPLHSAWHFAMHAVLNEDNPMLSALYFSADGEESKSYLTAAELYEQDLNADLVVLSACNTGHSTFDYSQGPMSLARAFAYSGAKSTVLSIWPAPDHATSLFFPLFYAHLNTGLTKARALQQAKLDWLKNTDTDQFRHPYYWNAFTIWGSMEALPYLGRKNTPSLISLLSFLTLAILVFLGLQQIQRRY